MPLGDRSRSATADSIARTRSSIPRVLLLIVLVYGFLLSIGMLSESFKLFSGGFVDRIIQNASNPLVASLRR